MNDQADLFSRGISSQGATVRNWLWWWHTSLISPPFKAQLQQLQSESGQVAVAEEEPKASPGPATSACHLEVM